MLRDVSAILFGRGLSGTLRVSDSSQSFPIAEGSWVQIHSYSLQATWISSNSRLSMSVPKS